MTSTGKGQKLCRLLKRTSPASYIFWMPGMSEMRMPWPSSTRSNPSSLISRNIISPSVCRPEFQQVEKESMNVSNECSCDRCCFRLGHALHRQVAHVAPGQSKNRHGQCSVHDRGQG